jgi:signal transduction histidine kinase
VIAGFAKTLERGGGLDDRQERFLGLIYGAAEDMDRMIENVSTIAHVLSGRWVAVVAAVSTGDLAASAIAAVHPVGERTVVLRAGQDASVRAEREKTPTALAHLAEAAIRLEPATAEAWISATADGVRIGPFGADLLPIIAEPGRDVSVETARIVLDAVGASIEADGDAVRVRFAAI